MFDIKTLLILIPALPLAATLLTAALGKRVLRGRSHLPVVAAIALSFVASMFLVFRVQERIEQTAGQGRGAQGRGRGDALALGGRARENNSRGLTAPGEPPEHRTPSPGYSPPQAASASTSLCGPIRLTAVMLAIVTCISTLVAIYSIGYMRGDPGYWRFFTYIGLFVFSMTMLVSAGNFVLLYVFWEAVGLCSYLLIGFWYEKPAAAAAGKKAFLVNRIGDFGFALGIFLIWTTYGTLDFRQVFSAVGPVRRRLAADGDLPAVALGGVRQERPVPAARLAARRDGRPHAGQRPDPCGHDGHRGRVHDRPLHAAFRRVGRCPCAVAVIGGITALLGGIIAMTQTDLKRILAYSTISQLGYMFLALGTGPLLGVTAGIFHLLTHAFFKALLFLCAGSVMHAMGGVIDIRRLGGLRRRMPVTHWTFLVGCLAIAGVGPWPASGARTRSSPRFCCVPIGVPERSSSFFPECNLRRPVDRLLHVPAVFPGVLGQERVPPEAGGHAHESPGVMTFPLVVLAFGSVVVGAYFAWTGSFDRFLANAPTFLSQDPDHHGNLPQTMIVGGDVPEAAQDSIGFLSTAITVVGIALAAFIFLGSREKAARLARDNGCLRPLQPLLRQVLLRSALRCVCGLAAAGSGPAGGLVRPLGHRRSGGLLRLGPRCWAWPCGRCKTAWSSSTPWRWCWGCWQC